MQSSGDRRDLLMPMLEVGPKFAACLLQVATICLLVLVDKLRTIVSEQWNSISPPLVPSNEKVEAEMTDLVVRSSSNSDMHGEMKNTATGCRLNCQATNFIRQSTREYGKRL